MEIDYEWAEGTWKYSKNGLYNAIHLLRITKLYTYNGWIFSLKNCGKKTYNIKFTILLVFKRTVQQC